MSSSTSSTPQVFVTGGTGFLGSYLLRVLLRNRGCRVRALRRESSSMALVADIEDQIEWVVGDLLDLPALEKGLAGVERVYHAAAFVSLDPRQEGRMLTVNRTGTANLVNLSLHLGIEKFLHVSSIAVFGQPRHHSWIDEEIPPTLYHPLTSYGRTKLQAEMEVWRGMAEGLRVLVVHPSTILGSGDWSDPSLAFFRLGYEGTRFYPTGSGGFVDVRDAARFLVRLMESEIENERFLLNGFNSSYLDLMRRIALEFGARPPSIPIGKTIQEVYAWWDFFQSSLTGTRRLVTADTVRTAGREIAYGNEKGRRLLDFEYLPAEQTIRETCEQYADSAATDGMPRVLPLQLGESTA